MNLSLDFECLMIFWAKSRSQSQETHNKLKQNRELMLIQREAESKSFRSAWMSACIHCCCDIFPYMIPNLDKVQVLSQ
jgi:hypothetical protein